MRHSRGKMYSGQGRLCVCLSLAAFPHYCMDLDVTRGNGTGRPPVVHYWVDLQSVHGFRCHDNIAPNAKCKRVLVLALWLVYSSNNFQQHDDLRQNVHEITLSFLCHRQYLRINCCKELKAKWTKKEGSWIIVARFYSNPQCSYLCKTIKMNS